MGKPMSLGNGQTHMFGTIVLMLIFDAIGRGYATRKTKPAYSGLATGQRFLPDWPAILREGLVEQLTGSGDVALSDAEQSALYGS
jgi:hypothetical protein